MRWLAALIIALGLAWANTPYVVQKGDTLSKIARENGVSVRALMSLNNLESDLIKIGQTLLIPGSNNSAPAPGAIEGLAAWYGPGFHGRRTANGERYDMYGFTAAHLTLPFNTRVKVTNLRTGQSVVVRINDRGPFTQRFIIDLSYGAAKAIGALSASRVRLEVLP